VIKEIFFAIFLHDLCAGLEVRSKSEIQRCLDADFFILVFTYPDGIGRLFRGAGNKDKDEY
jgi:hypothetical protein